MRLAKMPATPAWNKSFSAEVLIATGELRQTPCATGYHENVN
jgi:hypothetical protein